MDSAVKSIVEGSIDGTIAVDGTDVVVHGLGSAAYTDTSAYDIAGAADGVQSNLDKEIERAKKDEAQVLADAKAYTNEKIIEVGAGESGATFTPSVSSDGVLSWTNNKGLTNPESVNIKGEPGAKGDQGEKGSDGYTPVKGVDYFDGAKGDKGDKGDDGYTPVKGVDYFDGAKGDKGDTGAQGIPGEQGIQGEKGDPGEKGSDGVSVTHSWNGTVLTVTSASGTSSVNLKGDKGDQGEKGDAGAKGEKGDQGIQGEKGEPGENGKDGTNGVSATHSWNGTTLIVTSASGTSSANLKGEPGKDGNSVTVSSVSESNADGGNNVVTFSDGKTLTVKNGSKGSDGSNGKDGTSVTVSNVSESDADGGSNTITFSDGKQITIKNGKTGASGKDGASGKSAYQYAVENGYDGTETEFGAKLAKTVPTVVQESGQSEEMVMSQKAVTDLVNSISLGADYETVDSVEEMTDTSKVYMLSTTGTIWAYGETEVDDTNRNMFDASNVTLNQNGDGTTRSGAFLTNFIPVDINYSEPYIMTVKGASARINTAGDPCIYKVSYYDSNKNMIEGSNERYSSQVKYESGDGYYKLYVGSYTDTTNYNTYKTTAYVRLLFKIKSVSLTNADIPTDIVITTPEPKTTIISGWYDTGATSQINIGDLIVQVQENTERIEAIENKSDNIEEDYLPDYWKEAIDSLEDGIKTKQNAAGADVFQFVWTSDIHGANNYANSNGAGTSVVTHIGDIAQYTMDKFDIPFTAISGDIMSQSSHTKESQIWAEYVAIEKILSPIDGDKLLCIKGNHDGAWGVPVDGVYYLDNIGTDKIFNAIYRNQTADRTRVFGNDGTYFYVDFPQKVRFIMLNSHTDGDGSVDADGHAVYNPFKNFVFGQEQLEWVANKALKVPKDWNVVIMSHSNLGGIKDGSLLNGIISAFNSKTTYSGNITINSDYWGTNVSDTTYKNISVSADFSNANGGIIAYFHGHNHKDVIDTTTWAVPHIGITTAGGDVRDANPVERIVGTANETVLDIVSIDLENQIIHLTRLGAGADREVSYNLNVLQFEEISTPVKGVDYWTETDKAEMVDELSDEIAAEVESRLDGAKADIVAELITQIGGMPVFGTVDNDNIITVTSVLTDGVYVLKYENENGTLEEIGTITVGSGESNEDGGYEGDPDEPITPIETNQIRLSTDVEGNDYVGDNGEDGYKVGYRISTSVYIAETACAGMCCTGYIPYEANQVIRMKNVTISGTQTPYFVKYDQQKNRIENLSLAAVLTDDGNGVYTGSLAYTGYFRITCGVIDDSSILTLDTEIV